MQSQPPFPSSIVDQNFFRDYGKAPATETYSTWQKWLRQSQRVQDRSKYVRCLALCANVADATVENWLWQKKLGQKTADYPFLSVAREHVVIFRAATAALRWNQPRSFLDDQHEPPRKRGPTRVAMFAPLVLASDSYHLDLIRSVVHNAAEQVVMLSVHELTSEACPSDERAHAAGLIINKFAPDAIMLLRLTPDRSLLERLTFDGRPLPTVLIHADRQQYPTPIIANVVPDHRAISDDLAGWLLRRPHIRGRRSPKVVMVSMRVEKECACFPRLGDVERSIRNERIARIWAALDGFKRVRMTVPDYGFRNALEVWKAHPNADAYVCLSDQLAVAIKHLLIAGRHARDWSHRVVGFDGSELAREEAIASFSQKLELVGDLALHRLCDFLAENRELQAPIWPTEDQKEIKIPVEFLPPASRLRPGAA